MKSFANIKYPKCRDCGKETVALLDEQPNDLCTDCFKDHLEDGKWALQELKMLTPGLTWEQRWEIFLLFTEKMCHHCQGPAPCHCWNDV